jgi:hypothetical protein
MDNKKEKKVWLEAKMGVTESLSPAGNTITAAWRCPYAKVMI